MLTEVIRRGQYSELLPRYWWLSANNVDFC